LITFLVYKWTQVQCFTFGIKQNGKGYDLDVYQNNHGMPDERIEAKINEY